MIRDAHLNRAAQDCLSGGGNMGALMRGQPREVKMPSKVAG